VAGGRSSPLPPSPQPTAITARLETFDELIMGAELPERWRILGDAASVEVAPFPDPVHRSLRIVSSPKGESNAACYQIGIATGVSLEILSDRPAGILVSLGEPGSGTELGFLIGADGSVLVQPGNTRLGDAVVDPAQWYRVSFGIDTSGETVTLEVEPRDAIGFSDAQASVPFAWPATDESPELCVTSPGTAGEAAFLDNLTVD
jgi:hypothetical protein